MKFTNFSNTFSITTSPKMNNITTSHNCQSVIEAITSMTEQATWFSVSLISFGIFGILINCMVIRAIIVLGQTQNQSIRLLMYLSMIDISNSLHNILRFIFAEYSHLVTCPVAQFLHIFGIFSIYSSVCMFAVTAIDRYFKVYYLEDYERTFTPVRFRITLVWYAILTLLQTFMATYFNLTYYVGYGYFYTKPANIVVILLAAILYVKSTLKLKRYKEVNKTIGENIQNFIKITQVYLYLFGIYPVYLAIASFMIRLRVFSRSQETVIKQIGTLAPCVAGTVNAIYFFLINKEATADVKLYLIYLKREYWCFQSRQIDAHELQDRQINA